MRRTDYCVDGASDSRPRRLEDQNTFEVISFQYLALNRIKNGRRNTEGGDSHRACFVSTGPGSDVVTIGPVSICL